MANSSQERHFYGLVGVLDTSGSSPALSSGMKLDMRLDGARVCRAMF